MGGGGGREVGGGGGAQSFPQMRTSANVNAEEIGAGEVVDEMSRRQEESGKCA